MFENGIILLDKNIQFISYIHGYQLTLGSCNNKVLYISPLFQLNALGMKFIVDQKLYPPKKKRERAHEDDEDEDLDNEESSEYELDQFEVLKL